MLLGTIFRFHQRFSSKQNTFIIFSLTILLFALGDGIFSYQIPIWMESVLHNVALVGIVMSSSSLIGFICDLSFPTLFAKKTYQFFSLLTFILALLTQLLGLFFANWLGAFAVMALWGVYYELFLFGQYHFLHTEIEPSEHAAGWGIAEALHSIGLIVAPILVSTLFVLKINPLVISSCLFGGSIILSLVSYFQSKKRKYTINTDPDKKFTFVTFRVWATLLRTIWPVYIFFACLIILDATIWTAGVFFAEELRQLSPIGALFVPAYCLPALVIPMIVGKFAHRFGKKHTAFVTAIPLSLILLIGNWAVKTPIWHVIIMLLAGSCAALILTESEAIFEDYVARLHRFSGEMIGLARSAANIGYIVGPLVAGFSAEWLGSARTLAIVGLLPAISGIIAMVMMRGKTRLPQQQLDQISAY